MRRRGQKVPQELLQARRGFELVGKNIAGRREGCLEFDCPSGLLRTRFLAGVYVTPCLLLLRAGPPMATAFVHVRLAWQVHALPANARTVAHLERMHMLGRACQDASISGTRRARLHTKAIATQGLGVGMGMVQSSASPRSGLHLVIGGGMDMPHCASTGLGLGYGPATHSTAGMEQPAATMCAHADWFIFRSGYGVAAFGRDGGRCSQATSALVQCSTQSPWPISQ